MEADPMSVPYTFTTSPILLMLQPASTSMGVSSM